mmetsp:Transcript_21133/g.45816  ORF Transcript_21133/g.45816 Transcript_21133/m.45816 type:complete len:418 (-) Transcript_21133:923-2176(-)
MREVVVGSHKAALHTLESGVHCQAGAINVVQHFAVHALQRLDGLADLRVPLLQGVQLLKGGADSFPCVVQRNPMLRKHQGEGQVRVSQDQGIAIRINELQSLVPAHDIEAWLVPGWHVLLLSGEFLGFVCDFRQGSRIVKLPKNVEKTAVVQRRQQVVVLPVQSPAVGESRHRVQRATWRALALLDQCQPLVDLLGIGSLRLVRRFPIALGQCGNKLGVASAKHEGRSRVPQELPALQQGADLLTELLLGTRFPARVCLASLGAALANACGKCSFELQIPLHRFPLVFRHEVEIDVVLTMESGLVLLLLFLLLFLWSLFLLSPFLLHFVYWGRLFELCFLFLVVKARIGLIQLVVELVKVDFLGQFGLQLGHVDFDLWLCQVRPRIEILVQLIVLFECWLCCRGCGRRLCHWRWRWR